MKIRKGFVSNSSTSSFTAIFNSDLVPEIMEDLGPEEIALLEQTTRREKLGDIEVVIYYIDGDRIIPISVVEEDAENLANQVLEKKFKELNKENKCIIINKYY
jgi:hypothetical protein